MPDRTLAAIPAFWTDVSRTLEQQTGLHFAPRQWHDMQRGLALAAARLGLPDAAACAGLVLAHALTQQERDVLAECLAVGETYFFRDPEFFEGLARHVLHPLVMARREGTRHLRLWSAGCSTGEEPYSLAMSLAAMMPDWRDWNISILATDFNASALDKARTGVYGRWSLRGGIPQAARAFLRPLGDGRVEVDPELRRLVRLVPLNLVQDDYPSLETGTTAMDVIVCRNVLIYFEAGRAREVLLKLGAGLAAGGWLFIGPVEAPALAIAGLEREHLGGLAALRKPLVQAPSPSPPPALPPPALPAFPADLHAHSAAIPPAPPGPEPLPGDAASLAQQAQALADAGDLARAEALCRQAMELDKLDARWSYLLASILSEQGAADAALRALRRTLYLEPNHVLAHFSMGSLAMRSGAVQTARRHLERARILLADRAPDEVVCGGGGMTAGELRSIIQRAGGDA